METQHSLNEDDDQELMAIYRQFIGRWALELSDRDMKILALRVQGYTLQETAKVFEITRERIRQIECRIFRTMKFRAKRDGVTSFTDIVK
jgi:DNA-directed RNA polymerase sigma subunit (sigma70/sigma32)